MKKELARFSEAQPEVDEVNGYSLWRTIYIHAFEVAVALDDTLAGGIVRVSAGLTVVRQYHQAVVLVPIHSPLGAQTVVLHQRGITIGIVSVMLMPYLRGSRGVVAVLVLIGEVVRLRRLCGVHLLHLGERFAHPSEGHRHFILRTLRHSVCLYQTVKVVVGISVVESTAELRLSAIATSGLRRVYGIGNTQDIVHSIVLVLVFHHSPSVRRKVHRLQTFTLLVVGVGCLRAVAQLGIDGMTVLVITYPVNNNALTPLFIARKANYLPFRIVMIGHVAHAIPAVVGGIVDKSTNIRYARHYGVLQQVVVRSNCILLY